MGSLCECGGGGTNSETDEPEKEPEVKQPKIKATKPTEPIKSERHVENSDPTYSEEKKIPEKQPKRGTLMKIDPEVWNGYLACYIPLSKHRELERSKEVSGKKRKKKKTGQFSTKFANLSPAEHRMYQAVDQASKGHLTDSAMTRIPHELLMVIMIYSQGFKFSVGDYVVCFSSGILSPEGSQLGFIKELVQLNESQRKNLFTLKQIKTGMASDFAYRVKMDVSSRILPMNKVFSTMIVIDEELWHIRHLKCEMKKKRISTKSGGIKTVTKPELGMAISRETTKRTNDRSLVDRKVFNPDRMFFVKPMKYHKKLQLGYVYEGSFGWESDSDDFSSDDSSFDY